jgi:hypothetical protein
MIRRSLACSSLLMILWLAIPYSPAQVPQQARASQDTWYEFLVKQFNRSNFDYGSWIEKRRRAFLEATMKTGYFWYSASATVTVLFLMLAYAKLHHDHRHSIRITAEMMADLYNHDLYSREAAREAIERYNQHIEQCNREIEGADSGEGRAGWGTTRLETLKSELQRLAAQLETATHDRYRLQEELQQKSAVVADLSMRLDALSKKFNGSEISKSVTAENVTDGNRGGTNFVGPINRLQEELYAERQKNKRLKGG